MDDNPFKEIDHLDSSINVSKTLNEPSKIDSLSLDSSSINPFDQDAPSSIKVHNYYRCHCNLIPKLKLFYKNNDVFVKYECSKKHNKEIHLTKFYEEFKYDLKDIQCNKCQTSQEKDKKSFQYCANCDSFYCPKCIQNHDSSHNIIIPIDKFDFYCQEHNAPFIKYCSKCSKNLCKKCEENEDNSHKNNIETINMNINIQKYKDQVNKAKSYCNDVVNSVKKYLEEIEKKKNFLLEKFELFKNINKFEIDLCETMITCAEQIRNKKGLCNYDIIKNVERILNFNKFEHSKINFNMEKISFENLISHSTIFLMNINNYILKNTIENSSIENLKEISKNHETRSFILTGTQLFDGRISCSFTNGCINIYNERLEKNLSIVLPEESYSLALYQLPNEQLLAGTSNGTIISYLIKENEYIENGRIKISDDRILKILEHPNKERLIVLFDNGIIKILNIAKSVYEIDESISFNTFHRTVNAIIINETLITISRDDFLVKFWKYEQNTQKFRRIDHDLKVISCCDWKEGMINVDNERIIVIGEDKATLINISKCIVDDVLDTGDEYISIFKIADNSFLLGGSNSIAQINLIENKLYLSNKTVKKFSELDGNLITKIFDCGNQGILITSARGVLKLYAFE